MVQASAQTLRVIWACMKKEIQSALTERSTLSSCITVPVNYLILLSLFVLSGSNAPVGVVMADNGPYAQHFYRALAGAHTFRLLPMSAEEAHSQLMGGELVATVTIPADFDAALIAGRPVRIPLVMNNIHQDLTDDTERGLQLAITAFYARAFPGKVAMVMQESDAYATDTGYIPWLAMSIVVIGLMVSGLLQAGTGASREWEQATVKELLLAPTSPAAVVTGKLLGSFLMGLLPVCLVLSVLVFVVGDWPRSFLLVMGISLLTMLTFTALGMILGMALKHRMVLATITRFSYPLLFVSGLFVPISFSTPAIGALARLTPVHYAIVLEQFAFKGFVTTTLGLGTDTLILCGFALCFLLLAVTSLRPGRLEQ
jgi:ABC-2 type transport system permease protein